LDFGISGWNVNLGAIYTPFEQLNIGAVYKSGFGQDVDLARSRIDSGTTPTSNSASRSSIRLDFPSAFGVGASWRPTPPLTLSADYTRTNWSQGRISNYFTLPSSGPPQDYPSLPYPTLQTEPRQRDTEQIRAGVEFVVIGRRFKWPLRAGYFADRQLFLAFNGQTGAVDSSPVYHGLTLGTGIIVGRLLVDVAYVFEKGSYRDFDPEGNDELPSSNTVRSHRVFLSLIYRHKR
jgi:long-subunit fatty acid transport protein